MTQSEAMEKIKKLLRRGGRTEAEIDTAQIIAAALAEKHNIDIAALDVEEDRKRNEMAHRTVGEWVSQPPEAGYASNICTAFFEVSAIILSGSFTEQRVFVGTAWHLDIADCVFKFLIKEFRWQWNKKRGRCKKRAAFMYGCYIGLFGKLHERFGSPNETNALQVSFKAKREAYMEEQWPNAETVKSKPKNLGGAAAARGLNAGRSIEIRPGVKGGDGKQTEALPGGIQARLLTQGAN